MPQAIGLYLATAALQAGATAAAGAAISTIAAGVVQVGIAIGVSFVGALLTRPKAPKPSDVKTNIREATQPRQRTYGRTVVGGTVAYRGAKGKYLVLVIAVGQGPINAFKAFFIDDRRVTLDSAGYVNSVSPSGNDGLKGRVRIETRLGTPDQTALDIIRSRIPAVWTDAHRGRGVALIGATLKQPKPADASRVFPNVASTTITAEIEGQLVYDPRTGQTVYSDNAALCIRDFLVSRWGLRLAQAVVAKGDADWIKAANICDEAVPRKGGGAEPRYRIAMTYTMADAPKDVLQRMLDACDGAIFPTPDGGLTLKPGRWEEPTVTLDEDAITGITALKRGGDVLSRANTIRAQYTSPDHNFEEVDADPWVDAASVARYGETSKDLQIYASPSHSQTRRLMKLIERRTNPAWSMTLTCNLAGLAVLGERFIRVRIAEYGIDGTVEVQGQPGFIMGDENVIVGIQIEVVAMDASAYAWDPDTEEGTPPPVPAQDGEDDEDRPIPTGFQAVRAQGYLNGESVTTAHLSADAPTDEDDTIVFEISSDGGASWVDVPHPADKFSADYGPLLDRIVYQARASTATFSNRRGEPTPVKLVSAIADAPGTPEAFTANKIGTSVNLSARAADDGWTKALQFRRGTMAQTFDQATVLREQRAQANDVRAITDAPGNGTWRYWVTGVNVAGQTSLAPADPMTVSIP